MLRPVVRVGALHTGCVFSEEAKSFFPGDGSVDVPASALSAKVAVGVAWVGVGPLFACFLMVTRINLLSLQSVSTTKRLRNHAAASRCQERAPPPLHLA